jgi:hypothetical protein
LHDIGQAVHATNAVTEITFPSERFSAAAGRPWIFDLMSSLISAGLICIVVP